MAHRRIQKIKKIFGHFRECALGAVCVLFFAALPSVSWAALSAGPIQDVGAGNVLVGGGWGSDDHGGQLVFYVCEMNIDGRRDFGSPSCFLVEDEKSLRCNGPGGSSRTQICGPAYSTQVLTGWTWDAGTSGGGVPNRCASDSSPSDECYSQDWQGIDPVTNKRSGPVNGFGASQSGTCPLRGYGAGNLKIINNGAWTLPPYMMPYGVYMSIGDDGGFGSLYKSCTDLQPIAPPVLSLVGLPACDAADPGMVSVTLSWNSVGADQYYIETASSTFIRHQFAAGSETQYTVDSLASNTNYTFKIMGIYNGLAPGSRNCLNNPLSIDPATNAISCPGGSSYEIFTWSSSLPVTTQNCTPQPCSGTIDASPLDGFACRGFSTGVSNITWDTNGDLNGDCRNAWINLWKGDSLGSLADNGAFLSSLPSWDGSKPYNPVKGSDDASSPPDYYYSFRLKDGSILLDEKIVRAETKQCAPGEICTGDYPAPTCETCPSTITVMPASGNMCVGGTGTVQVNWTTGPTCTGATVWEIKDETAPATQIGSGCTDGGGVSRTINFGHSYRYQINPDCGGGPISGPSSATVQPTDPCAGCPSGICSGTFPNATCDTASCGALYSLSSFTGPGPEASPGKQTWLRRATGKRQDASAPGFSNCSGAPPTCAMTIGGEILFSLDFRSPFDFTEVSCNSPLDGGMCSVIPGQTAVFRVVSQTTVHSDGLGNFSGPVNLKALIPGLSFSEKWCNTSADCASSVPDCPNGGCTKYVRITPAAGSSALNYTLNVRGTFTDNTDPFRSSGMVDSSLTQTLRVWNFDCQLLPVFQTATFTQVITYTVNSWGVNGFNKTLDINHVSIVPAGPSFIPSPDPLIDNMSTPGTGTFQVDPDGATCGILYTVTVEGKATSGPVTLTKNCSTAQFNLLNSPPILSTFGPPTCSNAAPPKRTIGLSWSFASSNALTLERSVDNFASVQKSYTINPGTLTCIDEDGASCGIGTGSGLPARAASGEAYAYRLVGPACATQSTTSNVVSVPSPDCAPSVIAGSATSTITSWCSSGGGTGGTAPNVEGNVSWNFCDPDALNWATCASGQTLPVFAFDAQSQFCVQISSDPNFASALFSGGTGGCGTATACGPIGAGSGCISGPKTGSAGTCAWGGGATCMTGSLIYGERYFYRVKVLDSDGWGGAPGPQWSPTWSCTAPNCPSFLQDHYIGNIVLTPPTIRAGVSTRFGASSALYNDDAADLFPRALYFPPAPNQTWSFRFCDTGNDVDTCSPPAAGSSTGTNATLSPPPLYAAAGWPVYCASTDTATCPTGVNRPASPSPFGPNRGDYISSGVRHTYPDEGIFGIGVTIQDNEGHACIYKQQAQVKQRVPLWYEIVPRQ